MSDSNTIIIDGSFNTDDNIGDEDVGWKVIFQNSTA
jgi:hypothetical protein